MTAIRSLVGATLAAALSLTVVGTAGADPHDTPGTAGAETLTGVAEAGRSPFYEPPAQIPSTPGTIIREEPATSVLDPLGLSSRLVDARRVMYASTDRDGTPIAVTGIVITPKARWTGSGERPLVSYAAGTQGMGDHCAPTRFLSDSLEYESLFFTGLLKEGYAIALTDYQGLGTPGTHTYMVRAAQGHAVLDMARAARALPGAGLSGSPIGIVGYSQGGGAAAAAAELRGSYAPQLPVKGVVAGAVPADLGKVAKNLDGSFWAAFLYFALVGLSQGSDIDLPAYLNEDGKALAKKVEGACVTNLFDYVFTKSSRYSADGRPITEYLDEEPFASVLQENKIGERRPDVPVLLTHSRLDDTIPYAVGKGLASDWCAQGADVRWSTNYAPLHLGGMIPSKAQVIPFLEDRFAGEPLRSNCWAVR